MKLGIVSAIYDGFTFEEAVENAEYLAVGEKNAEFYENVKKFGELANKYGMKLCYHNHDFEFEKVDGEYKLDLLYKAISPELLSTQLDTCWVNVG